MYPFSHSVTPAVRSHLDAQMAFLNDLSKAVFHSFQQLCNLNIQLVQTMLEETAMAAQQMCTADRADVLGAAAARVHPATEKLRAYQQHVSRVAADAQVDMARVTEQHVQETARTARALADEVARAASEETERSIHSQQETMRKFTDPFRGAESVFRANSGVSMQSGQQGNAQGESIGSVQGTPLASPSATPGRTGAARKDT